MAKLKNPKRKARARNWFFVGAVAVLSGLAVVALLTGALAPFERRLLDFRFNAFNQDNEVSPDIVYIDIDDVSLTTLSQQVGGWPWPRGLIVADLILNYVMLGNPSSFIFDVIYSELSPKRPNEPISDQDLWLADVTSIYPNASHAVLFTNESFDADAVMPDYAAETFEIPVDDSESRLTLPDYNFFLAPFDPLFPLSNLLHSVNHQEDPDGISRKNQMLVRYGDNYYPGLALRGLELLLGATGYRIEGRTLIMETTERGDVRIPVNERGEYQLNFYSNNNEFSAFPADNVIASAQSFFSGEGEILVPLEAFENKIVVFGASALGLKDVKVTPLGSNIPGPFLHITAMSNILLGQHLREVPLWVTIAIAVLAVTAIMTVTMFVKSGAARALVGAVIIVVWMILALVLFQQFSLIVEMATTLSVTMLAYLGGLVFTSLSEAAEKNKISSAMGKYLSPSVMNEVLDNYDKLIGEVGEGRELTILFSDIRSFSSISEQYSAETVVEVLNLYLEEMIKIVFTNRGTLDKIIGDAIMAFWGAPNPEEGKEKLACDTAIEMVRALAALNPRLAERDLPQLKIGVGLHTGEMIVGNIGSDQRLDYTAIGDNVNLGSRLEGLTKYYKSPILVSETTYEPIKDQFRFVYVDAVAVKGKTHGIGIYAPVDEAAAEGGFDIDGAIDRFQAARKLYEEREFARGVKEFESLANGAGGPLSGVSDVFRTRCVKFAKDPPPANWNGVWTMTEK